MSKPQPSLPDFNVLVVDDDPDSAESLAFCLQRDGRSVRFAVSADEALAVAETFAPHLALVDIFMPQVDGHALARELRQRFGAGMVLVAVTGAIRSVETGAFDVQLTKPVDFNQLEQLFQRAQAQLNAA
jgi:CheY-like chemotaxis protein